MYNDERPYGIESTRTVQGIMFCWPSRQRFIPYSCLLYSELNDKETELRFHYTHAVVTVTGKDLEGMHEAVIRFYLYAVREGLSAPPSPGGSWAPAVTRIEITEMTPE
jgi:hypothetical protein